MNVTMLDVLAASSRRAGLGAGLGGLGGWRDWAGPIAGSVDAFSPTARDARARAMGIVNQTRAAVEEAGGSWEAYAQAAAISGCAAGLAATGVGAALAPLCGLIGPIWEWLRPYLSITIYPRDDFMRWVGRQTGLPDFDPLDYSALEIEPGRRPDAWGHKVVDAVNAGYYPFFFMREDGTRDRFVSALSAMGWEPMARWSQQYGDWYTVSSPWYYGLLYRIQDVAGVAQSLVCASWGQGPFSGEALRAAQVQARDALLLLGTGTVARLSPGAMLGREWGLPDYGYFARLPGVRMPSWLVGRCAGRFERPGLVSSKKSWGAPKPWSTGKKVAVGAAVVGVPTGGYFLGRALGWWK